MRPITAALCLATIAVAGCRPTPMAPGQVPSGPRDGPLKVVATSSVLGDIVARVGGEKVTVTVLVPAGASPQSHKPGEEDVAALSGAELLFTAGGDLDPFLDEITAASPGLPVVVLGATRSGPASVHPASYGWLDPTVVQGWADQIAEALSARRPAAAATFRSGASRYGLELAALDELLATTVDALPAERRVLAADAPTLGHLAARYGLLDAGAFPPAVTGGAAAAALSVDALGAAVAGAPVPAVFVTAAGNHGRIDELGAHAEPPLYLFFVETLTDGAPADSYLALMRANARILATALGE